MALRREDSEVTLSGSDGASDADFGDETQRSVLPETRGLSGRPRVMAGPNERLIAPVLRSDIIGHDPADRKTAVDVNKEPTDAAMLQITVPDPPPPAPPELREPTVTHPDPPALPLRAPPAPPAVVPSREDAKPKLVPPPAPARISDPITELPTIADVRIEKLRMIVLALVAVNVLVVVSFVLAWVFLR
ncbi:MAG: hypothetical protein HYV07_24630 [Deltaproteobacteria bacterium]|nr:hypothetical protein [Deltaproteobacteria bacterium]